MDIYEQLGVKKYLNAHDTYTIYGGSRMEPGTLDAMREAAEHFVDINELQNVLGKKIAEMTNNEAAYLTSGASAGVLLASAACLSGDDKDVFDGLPAKTRRKNEIIVMKCQQNPFVNAVTASGAALVEIGESNRVSVSELERAISENTAGIIYFAASNHLRYALPLETVIQTARLLHVPVIVDAAAQLPPVENLWNYTRQGADIVIFSGGKTLRGPQCSGLILGTEEMVSRCKRYGSPNHGVCRSGKIGKEEMIGLYAAVKSYIEMDHAADYEHMESVCAELSKAVEETGAMRAEIVDCGPVGQRFPLTYGHITGSFSSQQLKEAMKSEGIYIGVKEDAIFLSPLSLRPQEVELVAKSLKGCVSALSPNKTV